MENSKEKKSQLPLPKIKILQIVQKNLTFIGIGPDSAMHLQSYIGKILIGLLLIGSGIFDLLIYIFTVAETFAEYTQSIYVCSVFILIALSLVITIFNLNNLYKTINDCECLINTSELKLNVHFKKPKEQHKIFYFLQIIQNRKQFLAKPINMWKNSVKFCCLSL